MILAAPAERAERANSERTANERALILVLARAAAACVLLRAVCQSTNFSYIQLLHHLSRTSRRLWRLRNPLFTIFRHESPLTSLIMKYLPFPIGA